MPQSWAHHSAQDQKSSRGVLFWCLLPARRRSSSSSFFFFFAREVFFVLRDAYGRLTVGMMCCEVFGISAHRAW